MYHYGEKSATPRSRGVKKVCNKRNPSEEEITIQYNKLVDHLEKIGLKPEDVPQALQKLQKQLRADMARHQRRIDKSNVAVS